MSKHRFRDQSLPLEERIDALLEELTIEEKVGQLYHQGQPVERLGIPAYNYWNEALHGVARAGVATVFPQAIGLAATFDPAMLEEVAGVISDEGRAKYNEFQKQADYGMYKGLTFWSPNVNIFRDPRWGRGHETYGEDPYLTGRMGVAFIQGIQGCEPDIRLKAAACAKHFVAHSGPEEGRANFNAVVSTKDLFETYLPAFEDCVKEGRVEAIMGAYNALNGTPCNINDMLLNGILRERWNFDGHVVCDCGAIGNLFYAHQTATDVKDASVQAIKAGCDLCCGSEYASLTDAWEEDAVDTEEIDRALRRLLRCRFKLGMFDDPAGSPYAVSFEKVACREHKALAYQAAARSLVLLKNDGILPLKDKKATIAVIGPNADNKAALLGNYNGTPNESYTVLEGLRRYLGDDADLLYAQGCQHYRNTAMGDPDDRLSEAVSYAQRSDVAILCLGLDATMEGEAGDAFNEFGSGDKPNIRLPEVQQKLVEAVAATGTPLVVILLCGSALELHCAEERAAAIIDAFYPGEQGGLAIAGLLFGEYVPSGRLPITFYNSDDDLPAFDSYDMEGRTYRYMTKEAEYPFGYGLSYTSFTYRAVTGGVTGATDQPVEIEVELTNDGGWDALEHAQLYVRAEKPSVRAPRWELKALQTVSLSAGQTARLRFTLDPKAFSLVDEEGYRFVEPGAYTVYVSGHQPDARSLELTGQPPVALSVELTGETRRIPN